MEEMKMGGIKIIFIVLLEGKMYCKDMKIVSF